MAKTPPPACHPRVGLLGFALRIISQALMSIRAVPNPTLKTTLNVARCLFACRSFPHCRAHGRRR
jgi:hypothetical protein